MAWVDLREISFSNLMLALACVLGMVVAGLPVLWLALGLTFIVETDLLKVLLLATAIAAPATVIITAVVYWVLMQSGKLHGDDGDVKGALVIGAYGTGIILPASALVAAVIGGGALVLLILCIASAVAFLTGIARALSKGRDAASTAAS